MAILDNFEVTVLTYATLSETAQGAGWTKTREFEPPGSENCNSKYNTCRKYIGVPSVRSSVNVDPFGTNFAVDYKVKCGFTFADQAFNATEYIVFRTYLDGVAIGSASVKRERWERSGSYRVRKHGKRYMLENEQRWIRQRWAFDQGLHGTIRIDIWRERAESPLVNEWGVIDLTQSDDPMMGWNELTEIAYDVDVKRPRVKRLIKVDLLPIATFEFEYRSEDTLHILGLLEDEVEVLKPQHMVDQGFCQEDDEMWRTLTNSSGSALTDNAVMHALPSSQESNAMYSTVLANEQISPSMEHTDAIGRSLFTGWNVSDIDQKPPGAKLATTSGDHNGEDSSVNKSVDSAWRPSTETFCEKGDIRSSRVVELVDLTMD